VDTPIALADLAAGRTPLGPRTGPIARAIPVVRPSGRGPALACWDCGAAPGQRHRARCDLSPAAAWLADAPDAWGPWLG